MLITAITASFFALFWQFSSLVRGLGHYASACWKLTNLAILRNEPIFKVHMQTFLFRKNSLYRSLLWRNEIKYAYVCCILYSSVVLKQSGLVLRSCLNHIVRTKGLHTDCPVIKEEPPKSVDSRSSPFIMKIEIGWKNQSRSLESDTGTQNTLRVIVFHFISQ